MSRHHPDQGARLNTTEHARRSPAVKTGLFVTRRGLLSGGGSGAGFLGVTAVLRVAALFALTVAALALSIGSASAATSNPKIGEITEAFGGGFSAGSIAVSGKNGHIYVADSASERIRDYSSATDTAPTEWSSTAQHEFLGTLAVAVDDSSGDVYVSDSSAALIYKFDEDGELVTSFGDTEPTHDGKLKGLLTPAGSFAPPSGLAFGIAVDQATGELYAIDSGHAIVDVFDSSGAYLEQTGVEPDAYGCGGIFTTGIAVNDKGGELLLSTTCAASTELPKAYRFDLATGAFIAPIDGSETPDESFGNLYVSVAAADSSGYVYISDAAHGVADVFNSAGRYEGQMRFSQEASQEAVAVAQDTGDVYLARPRGDIEIYGPSVIVPDVTTLPAEVHSTTEATLNGEVNPDELQVTECFFEYGKTTAYGQTAECEPDAAALGEGASSVATHADLTGLTPGATYHYRLVAANPNGPNKESGDQEFFTGASIDATFATAVSSTSATLATELNPHGLATTYHFEYDAVEYTEGGGPHGTSTPTGSAGAGTTDVTRTAQISGLQPETIYHFRLVATNSLGTVEGPDHTFTTQPPSTSQLLPDARAWELVSPPDKHGSSLESAPREGGDIQAAAEGGAIAYFAKAPITAEPPANRSPSTSQVLSTRTAAGWQTEEIATPNEHPVGLHGGFLSEYQLFSLDLSLAAVEPVGATPLVPQATERTPYLRQPDGTYLPLLVGCPAPPASCPEIVEENADVPPGSSFGGLEGRSETFEYRSGVEFVAASPDLRHVLLTAPQALTPGFAPGYSLELQRQNLYEWSAGALRLVSQIPAEPDALTCAAAEPSCLPASETGSTANVGATDENVRGAVSADGDRVVFETQQPSTHLFLRDLQRHETLWLDAAQLGPRNRPGGNPLFSYATSDGSAVFFTDSARLTAGSTAAEGAPDLYMCSVVEDADHLACDLHDLSAPSAGTEPADVLGTPIGAAADGSSVYFVANGALVPGASPGDCGNEAIPADGSPTATCNIYRYDTATAARNLVASISGADGGDWGANGPSTGRDLSHLTARVSPDGRWLAFMSRRPLTGYDNRDARSGVRDEEVFLYDSQTERLVCASCNPTGARPSGAFDPSEGAIGPLVDRNGAWGGTWLAASLPGWTKVDDAHALYQPRYLSDSGRLFFNAADALAPNDSNGTVDVYQYEPPVGAGQPPSDTCNTASPGYSPASAGCIDLISSGTSREESAFMDASETGDDAFFLTSAQLTPRDFDTALDLYDARVGGGEPQPVSPVECSGDACQQPAVPPNDATPGSLTFNGPGNLRQCPTGKRPKNGKCVKRKATKKHKHRHHKRGRRRANANRGGQR
jgi:DNA-binding beta-propeller fold protein YncE